MVKMRVNQNSNATCECCKKTKENSLQMYDIKFGSKQITICDLCNEVLFNKVLKASVNLQARTKSADDIKIINSRRKSRSKQNEKRI